MIHPAEKVGESFDSELLIAARNKSWQALAEIAASIKPGMKESEATLLGRKIIANHGAKKMWHPVHIRFGKHTLLGYKEEGTEDLALQENDLFFIDIGPVFSKHEGDVGDTFVVGEAKETQLYNQAKNDVKKIFDEAKEFWVTGAGNGRELYEFVDARTVELGWKFNPGYVRGHRLSEFSHQKHQSTKIHQTEHALAALRWVLEIQIRHPTLEFGAFYEDLLI